MKKYRIYLILLILLNVKYSSSAQNYRLMKGTVYEYNQRTGKTSSEKIGIGDILDNNAILTAEEPFVLSHKKIMWIPHIYEPCYRTKVSQLTEVEAKDPVAIRVQGVSVVRGGRSVDAETLEISAILNSNNPPTSKYDIWMELLDHKTGDTIDGLRGLHHGQQWDLHIYNFEDFNLSCMILYQDVEGWCDLSEFIQYADESQTSHKSYEIEANSKTKIHVAIPYDNSKKVNSIVVIAKRDEIFEINILEKAMNLPMRSEHVSEVKFGYSKLLNYE